MDIGKVMVDLAPDGSRIIMGCLVCRKAIPTLPYIIGVVEDLVGLAEEHECAESEKS